MSIATRIQSIEEHISDAYDSLSKFGVTAPSNKNIENIASLVDEIYDSTPKTDYASGTNLALENTRVGKIDFKDTDDIEKIGLGVTDQYTTTGKNKLAIKQLTTQTINGVTFTPHYTGNKLDYVNVNGTASATASYILDSADVDQVSTYTNELPSGTYILDDFSGGSSVYTAIFFRYYTSGTTFTTINSVDNSRKFTINSTFKYASYIRIASGQNVNNMKFYPQLETGNAETTYEPYTNGASPNPSYPQNINVVKGNNVVGTSNKNIARLELEGQIRHYANGKPLTISGFNGYIANVKPNTTYVSSCQDISTQYAEISNLCYFDDNMNFLSGNAYNGRNKTFATPSNCKYVSIAVNQIIVNFQLEEGDTATSYVPHQGNNFEINLGKNLIQDETFVQGSFSDNTNINRISCRNIKLKANTTYTFSSNLNYSTYNIAIFTSTRQFPTSTYIYSSGWKTSNFSFTTGNDDVYANITVKKVGELPIAPSDVNTYHFQIEKGSTATSYAPYFTPIELCKINTYQDYIYKNGKN